MLSVFELRHPAGDRSLRRTLGLTSLELDQQYGAVVSREICVYGVDGGSAAAIEKCHRAGAPH
jgi:hypothetical protein